MRLTFLDRMHHLRRYRHIMAVLLKYGFDEVVEALRRRLAIPLGGKAMPKRVKRAPDHHSRPRRVRMALQELGPTFIKLGQLLSTRPDLVPHVYIEELEHLQDRVAPVPFARIRKQIEAELKGSLNDLFPRFDPEPIASASIAQVHRAATRDGAEVVVKVRRPDIVHTIRTECQIIQDLATLIKGALPEGESIDPVRMANEFTRAVNKEVDLANEARNIKRFARNFKDDKTVHIPRVHRDYSTEAVLTMEYMRGIKASDIAALQAAGLDPKVIADRGASFILRQLFDFGFFHADPHPGNIFVMPENVLAPLDFGQVARLGRENRDLMTDIIIAVTDTDADRMVHAFNKAGMVGEQTNPRALKDDLEEMLDTYTYMPLKDIPMGQAIRHTFDVMRRHHIHPPAEFTLMLKSLMTIESLAMALDSDFDLTTHLQPYARRLALERMDPRRLWRVGSRTLRDAGEMVVSIPEQVSAILSNIRRGRVQVHVQHEHLEQLTHTLDRSSNRIAFGLIIAGTVVGSSMLVTLGEGTVLGLVRHDTLGIIGYLAAGLLGFWLLVSILRSRRV